MNKIPKSILHSLGHSSHSKTITTTFELRMTMSIFPMQDMLDNESYA